MDFLKARSTGLTLVLAVALALGLSLAPVPEALRPFPSLQRGGPLGPKLVALVVPASLTGKRPARPADLETGLATGPTTPPEEEDEAPDAGSPELATAPAVPVVPTTPGIGLEELSAPTLARALELEALRERMGARHVDLELNCRKAAADGTCLEDGLAPFTRALAELRADARRTPVRVVHLGDSLVASDYITDVVRDRLQERFGNGGKGFLFITRPASAGRWTRSGRGSDGWQIERLVDTKWPRDRVGWTGVAFTPNGGPQSTRYDVENSRVAELLFLAQPSSGSVQLSADGKPLQRIQTRGFSKTKSEAAFARVNLPEGAKTLSLTTSGKVELHGVVLETGTPGIVYDTVGLLGGMAEVYLRAQPAAFKAQLKQRKPSMVVLMVGGNEAFFYSRERTTLDQVRAQVKELVARVRANVPDAACLAMSPIDAGVRTMSGEVVPRRGTKEVADILREEARAGGCAFWDAYTAMGGEGSAIKWLDEGLMLDDLVHPRAKGSDLLGHLFDLSLQRSFAKAHKPLVAAPDAPGLQGADAALVKTFDRLKRRESGEALRVGISQLGASHTASHYFTDAVREVLVKRFGDAGRGFIAAGKPSARLDAAKVARELEGEWTVEDAKEAPPGGLWGLTGIRAVGAPGAKLRIQFCKGCPDAKTPAGRLDLYTLDVPETGAPDISVDGQGVPPDAPLPEPLTAPTVRIRSFPVTGPAHTVQVAAPASGGVTVLGASLEYDTPGIVLDALGLPGATASTLAGMDAAAVDTQLASRRPDLLVFWYGTNEAAQGDLDAAALRADYGALISRLRKAANNAECLLLGPTDRLEQDTNGRWREAPALASVLTTLPQVARDAGCAYWSPRAAMGGERSMLRWQRAQPALGHPDGVHLTPEGYSRLAGAFVRDLLAAYEVHRKGQPTARVEDN